MVSRRLESYLQEKKRDVDRSLDRLLPPIDEEPSVIHESMRYSVFAGGKRLRPILAITGYEISGQRNDWILSVACGLELVHTYSLIHDDLPCMDDDDLRRGQPTNHKVFGEAVAVLAGDALLTLAFECFLGRGLERGLPWEILGRMTRRIAEAIGTMGLVGGQVMDVIQVSKDRQLSTLEMTCQKKTASLIEMSLECGAALAGATPETSRALCAYGKAIGMAFQITDDILNVTGNSEKLGKAIKTDASRHQVTFPELLGLQAARREAEKWTLQAKKAIASLDDSAWVLRELADHILDRQS